MIWLIDPWWMDGQHEIDNIFELWSCRFYSKRFCCIYTRHLGVIKSELLDINLQYKLEIYKLAFVRKKKEIKSCNCLLNCIIPWRKQASIGLWIRLKGVSWRWKSSLTHWPLEALQCSSLCVIDLESCLSSTQELHLTLTERGGGGLVSEWVSEWGGRKVEGSQLVSPGCAPSPH